MASSFLNPTSQRVRTVPPWFGPVLPRVTNRGAPIALVNPFAVSNPATPGPIFPSSASYRAAITSALDMLFGTRPGERLFNPLYGLNMEALVYEALDEQMTTDAQNSIKTAVNQFVPQVAVQQVRVNKDANNNQVSFVLTMSIVGSPPNDLLTYSTPSTPSA